MFDNECSDIDVKKLIKIDPIELDRDYVEGQQYS